MSEPPAFDLPDAHRYFAAECFNRAWDLIDKSERTAEEDETMLRLCLASHWHWSQHPECSAENHSIAYWQEARVYTVLGQVENARRAAQSCLEISRSAGLLPFFVGYAYEALARVAVLAGDKAQTVAYLGRARAVAELMMDLEAKEQLLADLDTI